VLLVTALGFLMLASLVLATDRLGGKLRFGDTIVVPASEIVDHDLYAFAGNITMDGTVNGDLVVAGGNVRVNGTVTGDVVAAGGTIDIAGNVNGDVREAGGQVTIGGTVGEDVLASGGQLTINGKVGQDLIFAAGNVTMDGAVTGSIEGSAGTYQRTGSVGGTENVSVGQRGVAPTPTAGNVLFDALRQFVVVLLFGALALWLLPRGVRATEDVLRRRTLASLGFGVLALIGYLVVWILVVILIILLAIVLGLLTFGALATIEAVAGILALGVLTFTFVLVIAFIADALVGLTIGRLIVPALGMRGPTSDRWQELGVLALGVALVVIATSLPAIGGIVKLFVALLGLGALTLVAWGARRGMRPVPSAPPPPSMPPAPPPAPSASMPPAPPPAPLAGA
jgi:hypothetical protein